MLVFQRDPVLKGAIRKNELSGKIDIVGNLGWQRTSSSLTDTDVYQIHWYLEKNYGLKNDRNINKAMNIVASENKYHPIRECLEKLKWDGQPRIDNLLPRYLSFFRMGLHRRLQHQQMHFRLPGLPVRTVK